MRKKPVSAITIFLPTAEVKNWDHFIMTEWIEKFDAKLRCDRQKMQRNIRIKPAASG
jgi:hypothetical protein